MLTASALTYLSELAGQNPNGLAKKAVKERMVIMNMIQEELTLGLEAHKNQEFEAAAAHYQEILSEQPEHPETNHAVGLLLVANNQLADAIPFLFRALEHRPEVGHLWFDCLDAMIGAERWDEATHLIDRARQAGLPSDEIDFRELHVLHRTLERNLAKTAECIG